EADWPVIASRRWLGSRLGEFPVRAHKGIRGRVVIVGGSPGMTGAARMAARGAFGAGAGLVHLVVPSASRSDIATAEPDVQVATQEFDRPVTAEVAELLRRADAVLIGPGLGRA